MCCQRQQMVGLAGCISPAFVNIGVSGGCSSLPAQGAAVPWKAGRRLELAGDMPRPGRLSLLGELGALPHYPCY